MEREETEQKIREIKGELRLAMNGAASKSMRDKGLCYTLNFGVELPRLRQIAAAYTPSHTLAQALWKENVRECKILATLLYPAQEFSHELAEVWIEQTATPELAEHLAQHLLSRAPGAKNTAYEWIAGERELPAYCGYLVLSRLLMQGLALSPREAEELADQSAAALQGDQPLPARAAYTALCRWAEQSPQEADRALRLLKELGQSSRQQAKSAYNEIAAIKKYTY